MILAPILEISATFLIGWLTAYPNLKLLIIMIFIPLIFNSIQFWVQDNILKADKKKNKVFVSNARMHRSLTMKPVRYPRLFSDKRTYRSGSLTGSQRQTFEI